MAAMKNEDGARSKDQEALSALRLWQTFEYLSPQKPPVPELRKDHCVWALSPQAPGDDQMPWKDPQKLERLRTLFRHRKRFLLFGGIVPGADFIESARTLLDAPVLDLSEQRAPADAAAFVIPIDENGYVSGRIFISSVPWAMGCMSAAQAGAARFNFSGFFGADGVYEKIAAKVDLLLVARQLILEPETGKEAIKRAEEEPIEPRVKRRPLDAADVRDISDLVFEACGWAPQSQSDWIIQAQKVSEKSDAKRPEDPLNSFFAEELERVEREYVSRTCGNALTQYLEMPRHPERVDVDAARDCLVDGVHPRFMPLSCWPAKFPLVTAQQFAVNAVMRDLAEQGLFSVNGPPGTGKTTMLKDIVASVVQQRADVLYEFNDPLQAFKQKLEVERHQYPVWELDERLRGFGIVVSSANNGAVENISKELPGVGAIDPRIDIDYFSEVADSVGLRERDKERQPQRQRWGMVSAVLGSQANRGAFLSRFWYGIRDNAPAGKSAEADPPKAPNPLRPFTLPEWVEEFGAQVPSWTEARSRYAEARVKVRSALERAGTLATQLRETERLLPEIEQLKQSRTMLESAYRAAMSEEANARAALDAASGEFEASKRALVSFENLRSARDAFNQAQEAHAALLRDKPAKTPDEFQQILAHLRMDVEVLRDDRQAHQAIQPGLMKSIFNRASARAWQARYDDLNARIDEKNRQISALRSEETGASTWHDRAARLEQEVLRAQAVYDAAVNSLSDRIADPSTAFDSALKAVQLAEDAYRHCLTVAEIRSQAVVERKDACAQAEQALHGKQALLAQYRKALVDAGLGDPPSAAWNLFGVSRDVFHSSSPYQDDEEVFKARRELFVAAMELHKAFVVAAWRKLKPTLYAFASLLQGQINANQFRSGPMPLWDTFFLVVPLISTTFASFPRLFRGVREEQLAWVLIDEAGQAAPQQAVGALWRAKRAVIVGDPLQLEPVVGVPKELTEPLRERCGADIRYVPPAASAQTLADHSNRFGTYLDRDGADNRIWLGAPLVVHRRCLNPMFDISNKIAYGGKMVYGAGKDSLDGAVPDSQWIDMPVHGADGHWIPDHGGRAMSMVETLIEGNLRDAEGKLKVYIVTPFKRVAEQMTDLLEPHYGRKNSDEMCGTVHTFQGKEADYVIFLLGGDPLKPGVISGFAGKTPNLVNVAVTRAKKRLYVIGNLAYWTGSSDVHGYFKGMAEALAADF